MTHTPPTLSAITDVFSRLGFHEAHVAILTVPMAHATGLTLLLAGIRFGIPMVLLERFDADAVLDAIERHCGTWLLGLPFMYAEILRHQRMRPRRTGSLRVCVSAGDVCPPELQQDFADLFGTPLRSIWGMTEAIGALTYGPRPGPVHRIVPGAEIRLVDDEGAQVQRGKAGELLVRGPNVTIGYWRGPGWIEDVTEDGWLHTGDMMRWAEGDELCFVGRKKDLIVRGGSNISPIEVERVMRAHPAVHDVAVAGVHDALLGQRVVAFVQLKDSFDEAVLDQILRAAEAQLADYKVPERLIVVDAIPRNALGKIDRKSLPTAVVGTSSPGTIVCGDSLLD